MAQFSLAEDTKVVSIDDVASTMIDLIVNAKYPGGTVYKIDTDGGVVVDTGGKLLPEAGTSEIMERINAPIVELMKKERGRGS